MSMAGGAGDCEPSMVNALPGSSGVVKVVAGVSALISTIGVAGGVSKPLNGTASATGCTDAIASTGAVRSGDDSSRTGDNPPNAVTVVVVASAISTRGTTWDSPVGWLWAWVLLDGPSMKSCAGLAAMSPAEGDTMSWSAGPWVWPRRLLSAGCALGPGGSTLKGSADAERALDLVITLATGC